MEEKKANISAIHKRNKPKVNPFLYSPLTQNEETQDGNDANINIGGLSYAEGKSQYYQERTSTVQKIEKTMSDLQGMFTRMAHFVHEQQYLIERIDNNTDVSLNNIEAGLKEVIKIKNDVSSNRALLLKIFFIIILASVLYILFFL